MAGGIFSAANPSFVARELANQLKDSGACYLLVAQASLDTALEAAKIAGLPADRIRYFDADALFEKGGMEKGEQKGVKYWNSIFAGESEARAYQWPDLKGELVLPVLCRMSVGCDPTGSVSMSHGIPRIGAAARLITKGPVRLCLLLSQRTSAQYISCNERDVFPDLLRVIPPVKRTDNSVQAPTKPQKQS